MKQMQTYCGIGFDMTAYRSIEEFSRNVWTTVFVKRDAIDDTKTAVRKANLAQQEAERDWRNR